MPQAYFFGLLFLALLLSACGGGSGSGKTTDVDSPSDEGSEAVADETNNGGANGIALLETIVLYNTKVVFTDDPATISKNYVDNLNRGIDESAGEMMIYLPPVAEKYRGILFFDGSSGTPRYQAGYAAECMQFISVELGWTWQNRMDPDKDSWDADYRITELVAAIADYTGYPEIANIPWAFCPRQVGNRSIGRHVTTQHPELADRVVAIGYGFGDGTKNQFHDTTMVGFPVSYAEEVRHRFADQKNTAGQTTFSLANNYHRISRREGSLLAAAGEQGFSRHYNNSKPDLGLMLVARAVANRVAHAPIAEDGTTTLTALDPNQGWMGSLVMPEHERGTHDYTYTDWTEIAPTPSYTGPLDASAWLIDEEFAVAWRGYMTPDPLIEITAPTNSFHKAGNYFGRAALLEPGDITITWQAFEPISSQHFARLSQPDSERQSRVERVDIYQGDTLLGGANAIDGSITVPFEPGIHLLVAVATLDDGSKSSSWPIGFGVKGNWYNSLLKIHN